VSDLPERAWTVIVPLKPATCGKSRLGGADEGLVRAIGLDTVAAASRSAVVARVIVVTSDAATAAALAGWHRVEVLAERASGLNTAIAQGMATAGTGVPRAALLGDLPALRSDELEYALRGACSHERAVVPDADGTGTTLVTARADLPWASAFGRDSFAKHLDLGCVPLTVDARAGLRRDVDTDAQLQAIMGDAGPRTRAALAAAAGSPQASR
jgi:2-phospho-L-lactate guanylyltransferase